MNINKESFNLISNQIYHLLNYTVPGIFLLEIINGIGLFSKTPSNLFEFTLYLIWSLILSIPFNIIDIFTIENFVKKCLKKYEMKNGSPPHTDKEEVMKDIFPNAKKVNSLIQFSGIILYLPLIYLSYSIIQWYDFTPTFMGMNKNFILLINTMVLFFILIFPLTYMFVRFIELIIIEIVIKKNK